MLRLHRPSVLIRWKVGFVAGNTRGKLHLVQVGNVSPPMKVVGGLQFAVLSVIKNTIYFPSWVPATTSFSMVSLPTKSTSW